MSETTTSQELEATLNKTDLGHIVYEKRKVIMALLGALLVIILGWVSMKSIRSSQETKGSEAVFHFQNDVWAQVKAGKMTTDEMMTKYETLDSGAKSSASMLPLALEVSKFLVEKNEVEKADKFLAEVKPSNEIGQFFIVHQRAMLLEKLNKTGDAIELVKGLKTKKEGIMPAHLELLLGRLYMVQGNSQEAKATLEGVINNYPNDEEAKLAKLYLGEVK